MACASLVISLNITGDNNSFRPLTSLKPNSNALRKHLYVLVFVCQWRNGAVEVGRGEKAGDPSQRFMDYHAVAIYDIRYVGYSTGTGSDGVYHIKLHEGE